MKTYKLRIHIALILILCCLISVGFVSFWIRIAISRPEELTDIGFIIASVLFLIFVGPPIVLTITYFIQDFRKKISVDNTKGILSIRKNNKSFEFRKQDVKEVYHVKVNKSNTSKFQFPMFEYLLFVFEERQKLIVTNLICKPERLLNSLKLTPKVIHTNVPLIDKTMGNSFLTTQEFDAKVNEFYKRYKNKPDNELLEICKNKGYAEYAKKAARQILNEKNPQTRPADKTPT